MCGHGVLSEQKLASWSAALCAAGAGTGASPRRASVTCHGQTEKCQEHLRNQTLPMPGKVWTSC